MKREQQACSKGYALSYWRAKLGAVDGCGDLDAQIVRPTVGLVWKLKG